MSKDKSRYPHIQDIPEICGKYSTNDGSGILIISFTQHPDASYDLSSTIYHYIILFIIIIIAF